MDLYFYTGRLDLAATSLSDLQALIAALADEGDAENAATIARVTGKVPPFIQSDTGEPLTLTWYSDASTVASWVTDAAATLAIGLGYQDPATGYLFTSTLTTSISGSTRTATLALNTTALQQALAAAQACGSLGRTRIGNPGFTLHIRKTSGGLTETVALLPVDVQPGVLTGTPQEVAGTPVYGVIHLPAITAITGGGSTALDGYDDSQLATNTVALLSYGDVSQLWKLKAGTGTTDVTATPARVRAANYATSNRVWTQIG